MIECTLTTPEGVCTYFQKHYPLAHPHGRHRLDQWLGVSLTAAALIQQNSLWRHITPEQCLFLDIETTGLGDDADTLAFLVGTGRFVADGFELREYFLKTPEDEPAMLYALRDLIEQHQALVTFNGRGFDVPILQERYRVMGDRWKLNQMPNLDLLMLARLLWKRRLPSRRLGALETDILGVSRTDEDVPGWLIPQLYYRYLNDGDFTPIRHIAYHNEIDVLSMVTLGAELLHTFQQPACDDLPADDLISLGSWYHDLGLLPEAERVWLAVLERLTQPADYSYVAKKVTTLCKKTSRAHLLVTVYERWFAVDEQEATPCIELARHYEQTDLAQALHWARLAEKNLEALPLSPGKGLKLSAAQNRVKRIQKKLGKQK